MKKFTDEKVAEMCGEALDNWFFGNYDSPEDGAATKAGLEYVQSHSNGMGAVLSEYNSTATAAHYDEWVALEMMATAYGRSIVQL